MYLSDLFTSLTENESKFRQALKRFGATAETAFKVERVPEVVKTAVQQQPDEALGAKIIRYIKSFDPTSAGTYTIWMLDRWLRRTYRLEDLERIRDYLALFDRHRAKIEVKDILQYRTPQDLKKVIDAYMKRPDGVKSPEAIAVMSKPPEARVILDNDQFFAVIPFTKEAAAFWGSHEWCITWGVPGSTHADRQNHFGDYDLDGPFVIIHDKAENQKWALHLGENPTLWDQDDTKHKINSVLREKPHWRTVLLPSLKWLVELRRYDDEDLWKEHGQQNGYEGRALAVHRHPTTIEHYPDADEDLQLMAIRKGGALAYHRINAPSEQVTLAAIRLDPQILLSVNNPSEEMKLAAVEKNGNMVARIEDPSPEVRLAAVKQFGDALRYIDNPTKEEIEAAVQQHPAAILHVKNPPLGLRIKAFKDDVRRHPGRESVLTHLLPLGTMTDEQVIDLFDAGSTAVVPIMKRIENPSDAVMWAALKRLPGSIPVFAKKATPEMWWYVAEHEPSLIVSYRSSTGNLTPQYVVPDNAPEEIKLARDAKVTRGKAIEGKDLSGRLQKLLVNIHPDLYKSIKDPLPSTDVALIDKNARFIQMIKRPSPAVQMRAVEINRANIEFINDPAPEVVEHVLRFNPRYIQHVPSPTLEQQIDAVTRDPTNVNLIREPADEAVIAAVRKQPEIVRGTVPWLPPEAQMIAVRHMPGLIKEIPYASAEAQHYVLASEKFRDAGKAMQKIITRGLLYPVPELKAMREKWDAEDREEEEARKKEDDRRRQEWINRFHKEHGLWPPLKTDEVVDDDGMVYFIAFDENDVPDGDELFRVKVLRRSEIAVIEPARDDDGNQIRGEWKLVRFEKEEDAEDVDEPEEEEEPPEEETDNDDETYDELEH